MSPPNLPNIKISRWQVTAVCLSLAGIVWLVFGQTLGFGFVNFDDDVYVYENPHISGGLSSKAFLWAFTHTQGSNWHPLTTLSHMLDCQWYGLHPWGHHLGNVLLHSAVVVLLFLVLLRMTRMLWRSATVAAVFAIHPLRVESVAWVSERKDVLSGVFFMLTLLAYARYASKKPSKARYWMVCLLFALGLMCKPTLVPLPFVLLLLDWWPLNRLDVGNGWKGLWGRAKPLILEKIPLLLLSVASCVATLYAQKEVIEGSVTVSFPWRIANAIVAYAVYLFHMVWPVGLAVLYPHPADSLPLWEVGGAFAVLAGVSIACWFYGRRYPWLVVGWLWFLGMLIPVIGIVQVGVQALADRYTYLPQIGIYLLLVWLVADFGKKLPCSRWILGTLAGVVITVLAWFARIQASYWHGGESLWKHTIACTRNNSIPHSNLGLIYLERKQFDDAILQLQNALAIKPKDVEVQSNLGVALLNKGQTDKAIIQFQKALTMNPYYAVGHLNMGAALGQNGRVDEAIIEFQKVLALQPDYAEAHCNLAHALLQKGLSDEAAAHYEKAIAIRPNYAEACNSLAGALLKKGKLDQAIIQFQRALSIQPDYDEACYNLGNCLFQKGKVDEAIVQFQRALAIKPGYADVHNNLGAALRQKGQVDEAILEFQKTLVLQPNYAEAHCNLANALLQKGLIDEAITHYEKAIAIRPNYAEACNSLAGALMQKGQVDQAIVQFQRALSIRPDYAEACYNLGNCLFQKGRVDEAIVQFQRAQTIKPSYAEAHNNLGVVLRQIGRVDEAIVQFEKALSISPDRADFRNNLGAAWLQKGKLDEAIAQFEKALVIQPDFLAAKNSLTNIAWMLATSPNATARNGTKAVELAQQMDRLSGGKDATVAVTLAAAYAETGRFEEATAIVRHLLEQAEGQGNATMGNALQTQLKLYLKRSPFRENTANP